MESKVFKFIIASIAAFIIGSFLHAQASAAVANLESCIDRQISAASSLQGQVSCNTGASQSGAWTAPEAKPASQLTPAN